MNSNPPLISIIIPVYNAEKSLNQCVDSLVYQDYKNIEILIMEKASTDSSPEIAQRFEKSFPDIVRVISLPYTDNPARALNEGAKAAKGKYLCFSDPDDYFQLDAMGIIAEKINSDTFDMAMMYANVVDTDGNHIRTSTLSTPFSKENVITNLDLCTYWRCVIRRTFFLEQPEIYEGCKFADISWIPNFIAKADGFVCIPQPLYNYVANNGFTSKTNRVDVSRLQALDGLEHLLKNADESYFDEIVMFTATRFIPQSRKSALREFYIDWAIEHQDIFLNNVYMLKPEKRQYLDEYKKLLNEKSNYVIPKRLYVNGFDPKLSEEKLNHFREHAFIFGQCEVVVLNEQNCNLDELPCAQEALDNGDYNYVGHYFALKNIYENGGFYASRRVVFTGYLNILCKFNAAFSYFNNNSFSDEIFGSTAETPFIKRLLETYSIPDFYDDTFYPLSNRIKNVALATLSNLVFNGETSFAGKCMRLLSPTITVLNLESPDQISYIDFSQDFNDNIDMKDYYIIPYSLRETIINAIVSANKPVVDAEKIQKSLNDTKRKLAQIEGSDSYKLSKRLKKFGNTKFGTPFKKTFKWFLKKYRKHKYGIG